MGVFCEFLCSVLLFNAILGLDVLGLALLRPGRRPRPRGCARPAARRLHPAPPTPLQEYFTQACFGDHLAGMRVSRIFNTPGGLAFAMLASCARLL